MIGLGANAPGITVRNLTRQDYDDIKRVDADMWGDMFGLKEGDPIPWDQSIYLSRLEMFQPGFFGIYSDGRLVGFSTSQIINYRGEHIQKSWDELTDNGHIRRSHDPNGNALYVVSLAVSKHHRGGGKGSILLEAQKNLARERGLDYLLLGARIPGLKEYASKQGKFSPEIVEKYLGEKDAHGLSIDPEIRFYQRGGLQVRNILPNYEPDESSMNYGVLMAWKVE